ncbi:MAG: hypothetical protein Q9190_002662 [Brigantiaea leucoxantha]
MASRPQMRQPADRMSGGNILSRMLQLEKQSKQYRNSSANPSNEIAPNISVHDGSVSRSSAPLSTARPSMTPSLPSVPSLTVKDQPPHSLQSASPTERRLDKPCPSPPKSTPPSQPREKPHIPKSQTLPALSIDVEASQDGNRRELSEAFDGADDDQSTGYSEICLSPSWSDFGGAKRKKEKKRQEKEKKEMEKKTKKEEEKRRVADLKLGKRLNKKPPPAAMETQKMSSALRRNSIISFISSHSSSGDNSRPGSRGEKRLSVHSTNSQHDTRRSQSTPGTSTDLTKGSSGEWQTVVSPRAPQLPRLPKLGWHSRSGSSGTDKSKSWGSEDVYEKELVKFAYQFQASSSPAHPQQIRLDQVGSGQVSRPSSGARSKTDTALLKVGPQPLHNLSSQPPLLDRRTSDSNSTTNSQDPYFRKPRQPSVSQNNVNETTKTHGEHLNQDRLNQMGRPLASKLFERRRMSADPASAAPVQTRPSTDGSSYVHKQRMYQQQMSIARFEDEQAVRDANEAAVEEEEEAKPTENQASQSTIGDPSILSAHQMKPQGTSAIVGNPEQDKQKGQQKSQPQDSPQPTGQGHANAKAKAVLNKAEISPGSKVDRILGFRRRQKPELQKNPLFGKAENAEKTMSKRSSPPSVPPKDPEPIPTSPEFNHAAFPAEESSKAHAEVQKQPQVQSHSRTRTSSSQLLGDTVFESRPLPRSSTVPVLLPEMKHAFESQSQSNNEHEADGQKRKVTFEKTTNDLTRDARTSVESPTKAPEIVVESLSPEGHVRKTSIKRPRSNPNIQMSSADKQLPSLDFLPQLKHQPLTKPNRSPKRSTFIPPANLDPDLQFHASSSSAPQSTQDTSGSFLNSSNDPTLAVAPRSPLRAKSILSRHQSADSSLLIPPQSSRRRNLSPGAPHSLSRTSALGPLNVFGKSPTPSEAVSAKPIAKLFVICCKCNYWHDLPSKLYEAMAVPKNLTRDPEVAAGTISASKIGQGVAGGGGVAEGKKKVAEATLETMVKCPWCEHLMTTWCCAGWTAILYLTERHH